MKNFDLSLYLVLDANLCPSPQDMVRVTLEAVKGGCTLVQLRAPEWKKKKQLEAALLLKQALVGTGVPLLIDDHVDIALIAKADGVHVGQEDLPPNEARDILGPDAIIGLSVGSLLELNSVTDAVDYLGVGPVFSTKTKKDAGLAIGTDGLGSIVRKATLPVVAIGGINATNASSCISAGANGVAVVSAICGSDDPQKASRTIYKAAFS